MSRIPACHHLPVLKKLDRLLCGHIFCSHCLVETFRVARDQHQQQYPDWQPNQEIKRTAPFLIEALPERARQRAILANMLYNGPEYKCSLCREVTNGFIKDVPAVFYNTVEAVAQEKGVPNDRLNPEKAAQHAQDKAVLIKLLFGQQ